MLQFFLRIFGGSKTISRRSTIVVKQFTSAAQTLRNINAEVERKAQRNAEEVARINEETRTLSNEAIRNQNFITNIENLFNPQ